MLKCFKRFANAYNTVIKKWSNSNLPIRITIYYWCRYWSCHDKMLHNLVSDVKLLLLVLLSLQLSAKTAIIGSTIIALGVECQDLWASLIARLLKQKQKTKTKKKNEKREAISDVAAAVLALLIAISGQWRRRADRHVPKQPHSSASKSTIQSGCFLFRYLKHMHLPCIFPLPASSSLFVCWRSV